MRLDELDRVWNLRAASSERRGYLGTCALTPVAHLRAKHSLRLVDSKAQLGASVGRRRRSAATRCPMSRAMPLTHTCTHAPRSMTATAAETKDVNGAGSICTAGAVLSFASSGRGCGGGGRALIPSSERVQGARRDARTAGIEELRLCLRCWRIREGRMYGHWSRPRRVPWAYGRHGGRAMGGDLCVQMCGQGRREGMRGVRDRLGRTVGVKAVRVRRCGAHAWWPI